MVQTRSSTAAASPATPKATMPKTGTPFFVHAPSAVSKWWILVSLPLIFWDAGYVLLRPWSMEGGFLHSPLWVPYKLYGEVDHVYGWKYFNANNGFTAAQSFLNLVESAMYAYYLYTCTSGGSAQTMRIAGVERRVVTGRQAGIAVLVAFAAAVMTLSKTVLYWLCEYYSGFDNIGHNSVTDLIFLWIIPNGLWIVFSAVMAYQLGGDIVYGLAAGTPRDKEE